MKTYMVVMSGVGTLVGCAVLFKDFSGKNYNGKEKLHGRTVIVTGANTGIGKETSLELAKRGARVILACRDMVKCKKACKDIVRGSYNRNVECKMLDLSSFKSVRNFASEINENEKRLDILVNNAGVMRCPKTLSEDGIELQLAVNHFGHFLLTNLLLDKLKESSPSRIVVLSSVAHTRGAMDFDDLNSETNYSPVKAYNQSKLANIHFVKVLAKKLEKTGVTVNAVHPGIINTDLIRHMGFYNSSVSKALLSPFLWLFLKNPRQGAQTTIYCCLSEDLKNVSGKYFAKMKEKDVSEAALDQKAADRLWAISEIWTRMKEK